MSIMFNCFYCGGSVDPDEWWPKDHNGDPLFYCEDCWWKEEIKRMSDTATRFFKSGDHFGITTGVTSEERFIEDCSVFFDQAIESKRFETDWQFQLMGWLPQIVEICCAFRGYKSEVREQRVIACGDIEYPVDLVEGEVNSRKEVLMVKAATQGEKQP